MHPSRSVRSNSGLTLGCSVRFGGAGQVTVAESVEISEGDERRLSKRVVRGFRNRRAVDWRNT